MNESFKNNFITLIYFILILFICSFIRWFWYVILPKLILKRELDQRLIKRTGKGIILFVFFSGLMLLWERISFYFPVTKPYMSRLYEILPKVIYSFIILSVAHILSGIFDATVEWYIEESAKKTGSKIDEEFINIFKKLIRFGIYFIGITMILNKFNQPITGILGAAGVISFAIAFASQDTLSNMISGFFIIIDKPFKIGDRIKLASGEVGDVIEIGMRRTKILTLENNIIIVPNSEIAKTRVVNFGYPDTEMKLKFEISFSPDEDYERIKEIIKNFFKENLFYDKDYELYLASYSNSQMVCILIFRVDYRNEMEIVEKTICDLKKIFEKEKVKVLQIKRM